MTTMGQSVRIPVSTISIQGAYASGVVIARLKVGDTIQAIAVAEAFQEELEHEEDTEE